MLNQRINFGKALRPFEGYEMDYAVGTSYSLSLEALMFIPITLFFGVEFNPTDKQLTSDMLEALTKVPDKVQVFCQRGKIAKPAFYHSILAFWEDNIEQVLMNEFNESFHPKIWLVRYAPVKKSDPIKYKFICSSKNLTLCNDWDVAVHLEGKVTRRKKPKNSPLLEFMKMLNEKAKKKKIPTHILDEILFIEFEDENGMPEDYSFHPIGFNKKTHPLLAADHKQKELLIISPFLDNTTIKAHLNRSGSLSLFSNCYELDRINNEVLDNVTNIYAFNPLLEKPFSDEVAEGTEASGESAQYVEPNATFNTGTNLHAKLYITQNGREVGWFIGSANCTSPATQRNIEFLTEIRFERRNGMIDETFNQLTMPPKGKGEGMFIEYLKPEIFIDEADRKLEEAYRKIIFNLSSLKFKGNTLSRDDGRFDIEVLPERINFSFPPGWFVSIVPLSGMQQAAKNIETGISDQRLVFNDFEEIRLSQFLLCTIFTGADDISGKQLVLDMDIDFPPGRIKKIFTAIINNQERLFKYLSSILTGGETIPLMELPDEEAGITRTVAAGKLHFMPLYEKLLSAASRDKPRIGMVKQTLLYLEGEKDEHGNAIVSEEFKAFFEIFKAFGDEV